MAAGAWSAELLAPLGLTVPLIGERGYSVQSARHEWPEDLPLTVFEDRALVVARFSGGLRASSHVEFGAPSAPPDPRKWRRIEAHLQALGVVFAETPDRWCGPRPTLADYLPAIGRLQAHPAIHYAFGHQHLGLTLAAFTAETMEGLALGRPAPAWLDALRIERFAR
ncbi:Glycine oxidase [compost metagenome]